MNEFESAWILSNGKSVLEGNSKLENSPASLVQVNFREASEC